MDHSNKLLSDIVTFRSYSKYLSHLSRREVLEETINRSMMMHLEKFPSLSKDIIRAFGYVHELKVLPSMRCLQFSGDAIKKNSCRVYNCSFIAIDDQKVFSEILFLLLSGTGVGFSVQRHHTNLLPTVGRPTEEGIFKIHDSIAGWAQALDILTDAYFFNKIRPIFDYTQIRPKGSRLVTSGAKAPGPEPLKHMLDTVESKLITARGKRLESIDIHDMICIIADCVLAGGVRRSACISLFDRDDQKMMKAKTGEWWVHHPYRARCNNSVVLPRDEVCKDEFYSIFKIVQESNSGEPGFFWTDDLSYGTNPCGEISLRTAQMCNLTSVNQTGITTRDEFFKRIHAATVIGTLQATYTDFPFLRPIWKETTEQDCLLGVSFTGIADCADYVTAKWLKDGAVYAKEVNERFARKIGIRPAARVTTTKPEGTSSVVCGSSSGIHARHAQHYLRRIRINKDDALAKYLGHKIPDLVEDDISSKTTCVVTIPQKSPDGAIIRSDESCMDLFKRTMKYNRNWIRYGHREGPNHNNVSCTLYVKENEWETIRDAIWKNKDIHSGVSLLPFDGGNYQQPPFESCDEAKYEEISKFVRNIDLKEVIETEDETNGIQNLSCTNGACEIV